MYNNVFPAVILDGVVEYSFPLSDCMHLSLFPVCLSIRQSDA
jgi:hypothetical protein